MLSCSGESHLSDLFAGLDRGARHQVHVANLHGIRKRNHVSRGRDSAGTAEIDEGRAEIDDKESEHTEHDCCIGNAHESSGRAPAAFNGIGNIWIEAVDRDIHRAGSSNPIPQERATNAWWHEVIVPRRGEEDF